MEKLYIILLIIILVVFLYVLLKLINKGKRKGKAAERKTAYELRKIGRKKQCKIINNIYLPLYNGTCEIDHMMFGSFGIAVIETKGISGTVQGNGKELIHIIGNKKHNLYNPQFQNQTHIDNVIHHLKKGGFRNVPVYGIVVFCADDIKVETNVGIYIKDLKKCIERYKDAGCDTKNMYKYFKSISIKNPIKRKLHNLKRHR